LPARDIFCAFDHVNRAWKNVSKSMSLSPYLLDAIVFSVFFAAEPHQHTNQCGEILRMSVRIRVIESWETP
jgi:hypothetical protein